MRDIIIMKTMTQKTFTYIMLAKTAVAAITAFAIMHSLFVFSFVPTGSMLPTLSIGESVCNRRLSPSAEIKRQDIVSFSPYTEMNNYLYRLPEGRDEIYIKRVIGLPGDTVEIKNNTVYINGTALVEDYLPDDLVMSDFPQITVPDGMYFMMGDNRNASEDSRILGPIPRENIKMKTIFHVHSITSFINEYRQAQ